MNDKQLTHQLLVPKFKHQGTFWVQVEGAITEDAMQQLSKGVTINVNGKQHQTAPVVVNLLIKNFRCLKEIRPFVSEKIFPRPGSQ